MLFQSLSDGRFTKLCSLVINLECWPLFVSDWFLSTWAVDNSFFHKEFNVSQLELDS